MRAVPTRGTVLASARRGSPRPAEDRPTIRRSVTALAGIPLFDGFSKRHLRQLAGEADAVRFRPGHAIVEEGQAGEAMFVVLTGTAQVRRAGRKVGTLVPGDFFGELSALDGGPRTASVVPDTSVEVLRVFRHTLRRMVEDEPALAMGLLQGLARRLRQVQPGTPVG